MLYVLVPTVVQWKHLNVDITLRSILKIITRFMMSILPGKTLNIVIDNKFQAASK